MIFLIIFLACVLIALAMGVLSAISDFRGMIIPNMYSLIVLVSFFLCYGILYTGGHGQIFGAFIPHLISGGIVLAVTAVMFATKSLGAGDSKLATAFALWVGLQGLVPFLFSMSIIGGALGIAAIFIKKRKPFNAPAEGGWVARLQAGEDKVPYGIAIAGGALVSFIKLGYLGTEVFASFLM